jgi:nitroreductase
MENFLNLVKKRYSVRDFSPEQVEEQKLQYILECGRLAPSAANYQPWHVIVVRDPEIKKKLASTYSRSWFAKAPIILVICGNHQQAWKRSDRKDHTDVDASIIIDHMTLAAAEQDLGTCWVCNFDAEACKAALNLPEHIEPIAYLPLGYPAVSTDDNSRHLRRKSISEIVSYDRY